ncbi:putative tRNA sulfurtransferase [Tepiditoga spiralis]|uniref:Probable tRNA sulfurtransferase n=1 Tax=Tepiditoga spiralis TaxID=2108365 RepID=A0A7G1G679_9BACT|nr:tRNA uracil 4-sulfurtransferase ThiI [Tepiditoga spiralis]BBE31941.1 putative tRNA sulfurtransferase [Tepiditoga spiralis]
MDLILVKTNEIALKNKNKKFFEKQLIYNIKSKLSSRYTIIKKFNRIYLKPRANVIIEENDFKLLKKVFGIHAFSPVYKVEKNIEDIFEKALYIAKKISNKDNKTFKIITKRSDKKFYLESQEISAKTGEFILNNLPNLKVKMKNYDFSINIEVRDEGAFLYSESITAYGGLPVGVSSKGSLLLSGGIDSPVAAMLMLKRGMVLNAINFMSPPYTGKKSLDKIIKIASKISEYSIMPFYLYSIPFTKVQLAIKDSNAERYSIILQRRSMMRIASKISQITDTKVLITGESLGQVASQTVENALSISDASKRLIFRPLIGFDKEETIQLSKKYDLYNLSILPYEDSCTVFVPTRPATKSKIDILRNLEEKIPNLEELEKEVINSSEKFEFIDGELKKIEDFVKIKGGVF